MDSKPYYIRDYEIEKEQKATKYSDAKIREQIEYAGDSYDATSCSFALTAIAMIMYNRMIDDRWDTAPKRVTII